MPMGMQECDKYAYGGCGWLYMVWLSVVIGVIGVVLEWRIPLSGAVLFV